MELTLLGFDKKSNLQKTLQNTMNMNLMLVRIRRINENVVKIHKDEAI